MIIDREDVTDAEDNANGQRRLVLLFIVGFFIIALGIAIIAVAVVLSGGSASVGGFILVGPIPIVFGAGPGATWLVLFAIILGITSLVVLLMMRRRVEKVSG
jgi:uncharacterized membrane protein